MLSRRLGYSVLGGGVLAVFAAIGMLEPSSTGRGTHRQLGLSACAFESLTGWRCPSCGVTTASCHLARGNLMQAVRTHVTGTALVAALVAVGLWMVGAAVVGRHIRLPATAKVGLVAVALVAAGMVEWLIRLAIERFG
jgi:hypothetical protein